MPLFKHKKHTDAATDTGFTDPAHIGRQQQPGHHFQNDNYNNAPTTGILPHQQGAHGHGEHLPQQQGVYGYGESANYSQPSNATTFGHGQPTNVPPTGTLNDPNQTRGGSGQRITGKVESAVGSIVGSDALKAKGLRKEQEANAIKLQGQELAEAERLEREAMVRRERAVGHGPIQGAHPANKHLGAGLDSNRYD